MQADNDERAKLLDWLERERKRLLVKLEKERTIHVPAWSGKS